MVIKMINIQEDMILMSKTDFAALIDVAEEYEKTLIGESIDPSVQQSMGFFHNNVRDTL